MDWQSEHATYLLRDCSQGVLEGCLELGFQSSPPLREPHAK